MATEEPIVVRGRCACGRRFRIRNARNDSVVLCPNCRRVIRLTETDLQAAAADEHLIPLQSETDELLEVMPVDHGALHMAPEGSRPGLTGAQILSHEEAALAYSARGIKLSEPYERTLAGRASVWSSYEPEQRPFFLDLLASFYFAGVPRNALNILALAAACTLLALAQYLVYLSPVLVLLAIPMYLLIFVCTIQFFWSVLMFTANGEDVIPWAQDQWSLWYDFVLPLFRLGIISFLCTLPYLIVSRGNFPAFTSQPVRLWLVLGAGWFFWPAAVMSVGIGNSLFYLRPDWVIRCIIGVGPAYLAAWLAAMLAVGVWYYFLGIWQQWIWYPVIGFSANLYLGYVLFRICGLLFRHYRQRLPWKF